MSTSFLKKDFELKTAHSPFKTRVNACLQCGHPLYHTHTHTLASFSVGLIMATYFTVICIIKSNHARSRVNTHARTLMELSNGLPIIVRQHHRRQEGRRRRRTHPRNGIVGHFYQETN